MLISRNLSKSQRLARCAAEHSFHVVPGDKGEHVTLIQRALCAIDTAKIDQQEMDAATYGATTAEAVLAFKSKRRIINFSYQTKPDKIVGIMTIKALDAEMCRVEALSKSFSLLGPSGHID